MPATIADQASFLEAMGRYGDTFPPYTQHVGDQLLSHEQLISGQPVVTQ